MTTRKHAVYGILALVSLLTAGHNSIRKSKLHRNAESKSGPTLWRTEAEPLT